MILILQGDRSVIDKYRAAVYYWFLVLTLIIEDTECCVQNIKFQKFISYATLLHYMKKSRYKLFSTRKFCNFALSSQGAVMEGMETLCNLCMFAFKSNQLGFHARHDESLDQRNTFKFWRLQLVFQCRFWNLVAHTTLSHWCKHIERDSELLP